MSEDFPSDVVPPEWDPPKVAECRQALRWSINQSGVSGVAPSTPPVPVTETVNGGMDPGITWQFNLGRDGKLYGKGDTPPPGGAQLFNIHLVEFRGNWIARVEYVKQAIWVIGTSIPGSEYELATDQHLDVGA